MNFCRNGELLYASAHTVDGTGGIMFSGCPVSVCVRSRAEALSNWLAVAPCGLGGIVE